MHQTKIEIEKVSENLRVLRMLRGIKVESVAKGIGITKSSYSNIETGKTEITLSRLQDIADYFQIDYNVILHGHLDNYQSLTVGRSDELIIDSKLLQNIVNVHSSIVELVERITQKYNHFLCGNL
ncbi:helix-turn-helix transcriptional regulator [Niabella sp. W65]|nr:helix-turn-helix transcriptional regulator [Niabella sp. W65]MCH7366431.1 helix-turn-helix transcriptional regulator [Niabella sp. W65]